jgi:hypothetical protein
MDNQNMVTTQQSYSPLALPDETQFKKDIQAINQFQIIVRQNMIEGQDFGVIPGTGNKPTLLKPGAEKIAKLLGLSDQYIIIDRQENWDKPFFRYLVKCQLISVRSQQIISEGLGECNSMESKYRYRDAKRKCPDCGVEAIIKGKEEYGGGWLCYKAKGGCGNKFTINDPEIIDQEIGKVENEDIFSLVNTLLKMAKKRALVDASLSAGRLSNVFTQDIEDLAHLNNANGQTSVKQESSKPIEVKSEKTKPKNGAGQNAPPLTDADFDKKSTSQIFPRDPESVKSKGDLFADCIKDWPEKFAVKEDVIRAIGKPETDIVDPATEYTVIATKMLDKKRP